MDVKEKNNFGVIIVSVLIGFILGSLLTFISCADETNKIITKKNNEWTDSAIKANVAYYHPTTGKLNWRTNSPIRTEF